MKKTILSAAIAGLLVASGYASAATINFTFDADGTGAGAAVTGNVIDWAPGNTLAIGGAGGAVLPVGATTTSYYQANLNSVLYNGSNAYSNGSGGTYFTLVAGFGEKVTGAALVPGAGINTFGYNAATNPAGGSYFKMFANTVGVGNDLTGAGFVSQKLILSGYFTGLTASVTAFTDLRTGLPLLSPLDGFGTDDWAGVQTIRTNGSSDVSARLNYVDTDYFGGLNVGGLFALALTNSSLISPYNQANPSRCLSDGATDCAVASNIGAINGITGPDFLFQSDANSAFVPEPGSVALFGAALLGFAFSRKRKF